MNMLCIYLDAIFPSVYQELLSGPVRSTLPGEWRHPGNTGFRPCPQGSCGPVNGCIVPSFDYLLSPFSPIINSVDSFFMYFFKFYLLITVYIQYYFVLVSDGEHSG